MPSSSSQVTIDVANASHEELQKVQGLIMARLAQDVHSNINLNALYDSHGSNHTKNSPSARAVAENKVLSP